VVEQLRGILHLLGTALLWPVLIGLLALLAWTCLFVGAFAREWWARRSGAAPTVARFQRALRALPAPAAGHAREADVERLLQEADDADWRRVGQVRQAVRLGPALGLMGTLIPMAAALQGLADGNIAALAGNLVTAFSATVIGLAISIVAFIVGFAREQWVRTDSRERAFIAETSAAVPLDGVALDRAGR
jgi:biopolymer transport protein ExbB/TolQ